MVLVYSQRWATITTINFRTFLSSSKETWKNIYVYVYIYVYIKSILEHFYHPQKKPEKEEYIYITESLCGTPETNTAL